MKVAHEANRQKTISGPPSYLEGIDLADVKKLKEAVRKSVDGQRKRLTEIARYIHDNPELGSEELKAYELLTRELEENGFEVQRRLLNIPTAFCATFRGKGKGPRVAVLAEYDALPGVGHGCGHNLIAASAIGAGRKRSPLR